MEILSTDKFLFYFYLIFDLKSFSNVLSFIFSLLKFSKVLDHLIWL